MKSYSSATFFFFSERRKCMNIYACVDKKQFEWWEGENNPPAFKSTALCWQTSNAFAFFFLHFNTKKHYMFEQTTRGTIRIQKIENLGCNKKKKTVTGGFVMASPHFSGILPFFIHLANSVHKQQQRTKAVIYIYGQVYMHP